MFHSFLSTLLLFSGAGEVTALALFGRQQSRLDNTTLVVEKRQGSVTTRFSVLYSTGDVNKVRTANGGFDCRVDLENRLWGFCPTTVIAASDCGLAGSCFDNFDCKSGCGLTDAPLTTFICSEDRAPHCSTALLTLTGNSPGPYTYLACGPSAFTDEYKVTFTTAKPSSTKSDVPTPGPILTGAPESTSQQSTSKPKSTSLTTTSGTATSSQPTGLPSSSTTTSTTASSTSFNPSFPNADSTSTSAPNNTTAIIGAVAGCFALLCICAVAIVFIRRSRNAAAAAAAAATTTATTSPSAPEGGDGDAGRLQKAAPPSDSESGSDVKFKSPPPRFSSAAHKAELEAYVRSLELSGHGPAAYDTSERGPVVAWGRGYPDAAPVELPASVHWGRR